MIARTLTVATGLSLQLAGFYAAVVTYGAGLTLGLYAVGGLALMVQHVMLRRSAWSPGD